MSQPPFPSFIIIGAERAATRWLRINLDQHPDICAPPLEMEFFANPDQLRNRGSRWYREHFSEWHGEPFLGESTPRYLGGAYRPAELAMRMHRMVPDARLIAVIRQPLDRLYSAAVRKSLLGLLPPDYDLWTEMNANEGLSPEREALKLDLIRGGAYNWSLPPYLELYGDRLKVMLYDDLLADPAAFYREALVHIGAAPDFVPDQLERRLFANPPSDLVDLSRDERAEFYELWRSALAGFGELIGRDLSHWDPLVTIA